MGSTSTVKFGVLTRPTIHAELSGGAMNMKKYLIQSEYESIVVLNGFTAFSTNLMMSLRLIPYNNFF